MIGLLNYSLQQIASLRHFYDSQKKAIDSKSKKGKDTNRIGYLIDLYLSFIAYGCETDKKIESFKALEKMAKQYIEIVQITEGENSKIVHYKFLNEEELKSRKVNTDLKNATIMYERFLDMPVIHCSNTLVMLLTRFEECIANFLRVLYPLFPQKYLDNQTIAFSEISEKSTAEVRDLIVSRQIDRTMRESYEVWFKIFREHHMSFDSCQTEMELLKEIYARRNIIIHNASTVNETYLKVVSNSPYSIGEKVVLSDEYICEAFNVVKIIIFTIFIQAIKFIKEDKAQYLSNIFDVAFEELNDGEYIVSRNVFQSLMNNKNADDIVKQMSKVNYWISAKNITGLACIKSDVESFDVSALTPQFMLAKWILLENYEKATELVAKLLEKNELSSNELENWPLFKQYIQTEHFVMLKETKPQFFGTNSVETTPEIINKEASAATSIREEITEVES